MWPSSFPSLSSLPISLVPASLQKRLARFLLKRALGSVLQLSNTHFDLDTQIDVSLKGLSLRDLRLNLDTLNTALRAANIPLKATSGILASVSVTVPWLDLTGSSCTVDMDGVRVELAPLGSPGGDDDDDAEDDDASSDSSGSRSSSPASSAMMASSIYIANEFLRHGGATSPPPPSTKEQPPIAQQLADSLLSDPTASSSSVGGGLEGVQLLAGLIDTIIANLVISISNVSVSLTNHPLARTPPLHCEIPSITLDRASASFFEASKRVTIPQFRVRTPQGDPEEEPILWAPEPILVDLVVPSTANRPPPPPASFSSPPAPPHRSQFVARVDIPDLTARVTPHDLSTLAAWVAALDPLPPPRARRTPGRRHVSWTSHPTAAAAHPPSSSPSPPAATDNDEDESDFDQTDDDFLTSAVGATTSSPAAAATVFYSAMHSSVVAPSTRRDGIEVHVHQATVYLLTANRPCVATHPVVVVSLGALKLESNHEDGFMAILGPLGVVVDGQTVVHVPEPVTVRRGQARVASVQIEADKQIVESLARLADAVRSLSQPPARAVPVGPREGGGLVVHVTELEARLHGFLPTTVTVSAGDVRLEPQSRQVSVGRWAIGLVDKVSKMWSSDVCTFQAPGTGGLVSVTCARVDAVLTRADYLLLLLPPTAAQGSDSNGGSGVAVDFALSSLVLALPDIATHPHIHLLGVDFALRPAQNVYRLTVRRGHVVSGQHARLVEYVARPSSAGSNGGPPGRRRALAVDVRGQGSIHEVKLSGLCVTLAGKEHVQVLKDVGELFNVPPPPPDLPQPPPLTTSLAIRDSTLRLTPPGCHPSTADLDLECIDLVIRTGPPTGHVLLTGTLHALALTVAGYHVATIEGCKVSAHGEPMPRSAATQEDGEKEGAQGEDKLRFRVTLDRPSVKVHLTPESVAAAVMVLRTVQGAFTDPPPPPPPPQVPLDIPAAFSSSSSPPLARTEVRQLNNNLMATVDPEAFANPNPKPPAYDMDRLTLSIVEDFSAFESELDSSQLVMVDAADAAGSSGSDLDSAASGASSRASSVAGIDLIDDHFAEDTGTQEGDGPDDMWSPVAPPTRDGPLEWTWHLVVDGLSASVELSTSATTTPVPAGAAAAPADASSGGFEHVPEMPIVALDVFDVHVEHSLWAPGHPGGVLDTLTVTLGTLEVRDLVPMSPWNKMVTAARTANVTPTVGAGGGSARAATGIAGGRGADAGVDAGSTRLPGGTALPFARMDATCVLGPTAAATDGGRTMHKTGGGGGGGEWRGKVRVVPIKLHVFQETVDAVVQFASSVLSKIADDDEELVLIDSPAPPPPHAAGSVGAANTMPPVMPMPVATASRPPPFFQRVEVHPIALRIDYKPKSVDLPALQRGKVLELLNVFHLEGAEMTLRHVTVTGARGWDGLMNALVSYWVPHVRNTQLPGMVSGVGPLRSLVNIGTGVADLFLLPVEQYRRDGRLVKGLKKGAHSFVRTAAVETLSLGAKLAVGTHNILERADTIVSHHPLDHGSSSSSSSSSAPHSTSPVTIPGRSPDLARRRSTSASSFSHHTPASPSSPSHRGMLGQSSPSSSPRTSTVAVSKYANQPSNTREGLEQAMRTLSDNVTQAARVIAIPVEVMERDGATGTVRAVLRAVPIAVLKPMLGATDAVGKTLMGIRNGLDPERRREVLDKYKAAG